MTLLLDFGFDVTMFWSSSTANVPLRDSRGFRIQLPRGTGSKGFIANVIVTLTTSVSHRTTKCVRINEKVWQISSMWKVSSIHSNYLKDWPKIVPVIPQDGQMG